MFPVPPVVGVFFIKEKVCIIENKLLQWKIKFNSCYGLITRNNEMELSNTLEYYNRRFKEKGLCRAYSALADEVTGTLILFRIPVPPLLSFQSNIQTAVKHRNWNRSFYNCMEHPPIESYKPVKRISVLDSTLHIGKTDIKDEGVVYIMKL